MEFIDSILQFLNEHFAPAEMIFLGIFIDSILVIFFAKGLLIIARKLGLISKKKFQHSMQTNKVKRKRNTIIYGTLSIGAVVMMIAFGYRINWQPNTDLKQWEKGSENNLTVEIEYQLEHFVQDNDIRDLCFGIIIKQQSYLTCYSQSPAQSLFKLNDSSIFEIGSITKTFTYKAMLRVLKKHNIDLNSEIGPFLPKIIMNENPDLAGVTWVQLATHSSGLSRDPTGLNWVTFQTQLSALSFGNPFTAFTNDYVSQYLASAQLNKAQYASYSNLAVGLLGMLLADIEKKTYAQLILDEVAVPLGMTSTGSNTPVYVDKKVQGYGQFRQYGNMILSTKTNETTFSDALAGAGAINSSLHDMMIYLDDRMQAYQQPIFKEAKYAVPTKTGNSVNLGWSVAALSPDDKQKFVVHTGKTTGFVSFIGFNQQSEVGIVMMANGPQELHETGFEILKLVLKQY